MAEKRKISSFESEEIQDLKKARVEVSPIEDESINIVHTIVFAFLFHFWSTVSGPDTMGQKI